MNDFPSPDALDQRLSALFRQQQTRAQQALPGMWERVAARMADEPTAAPFAAADQTYNEDLPIMEPIPMQPSPINEGHPRRSVFSVAAVLLAALIVISAVWFGVARSGGNNAAAKKPTPIPYSHACPPPNHDTGYALPPYPLPSGTATRDGITVQIIHSVADASQTQVFFQVLSPPDELSQAGFTMLSDDQGHVFNSINSPIMNPTGDGLGTFGKTYALDLFAPLSLEELSQPQTLTLTIQSMLTNKRTVSRGSTTNAPIQELQGPWQVKFPVTPSAGHSQTLQNASETRCGITITALRLDTTTDSIPQYRFDPNTGTYRVAGSIPSGTRLALRISGLLPATTLDPLLVGLDNGNQSHVTLGGVHTNGIAIPDTTYTQPGYEGATVDHSGTLTLDVLFPTPLPKTSGTLTLHIDALIIAYLPSFKPSDEVAVGPWDIPIHLG